MEKARYGSTHGPLVDPVAFHIRATPRYKQLGIFPYCDACHEIVHLYGVHTPNPNITPRFDHANLVPDADPLDDCILANRNSHYHGLAPDGWDDYHGNIMREKFFEEDNLARAYAFCLNLCRHGNLPKDKFLSMLNRADRKRVWSYIGIPLWSIPYILLTLENFTDNKKGFGFHFSFIKPRGSNITALWQNPEECKIVKFFSSNSTIVQTSDNPYPVSEKAILDKAGDTSWIGQGFLQSIKI
ncbi:MAG: hypothetical protein Q7T96_07115 [Methylobacter sp.]|nr:hypothetical protein [Methylobacter sp.]